MTRPGGPALVPGPAHEFVVVDSDEELLAVAGAYLAEGLVCGDAVRAALPRVTIEALGATLPGAELTDVTSLRGRRAPDAMVSLRKGLDGAHPGRLRVLCVVTGAGGRDWDERSRCEAVTNMVFAAAPLSVLCVYDRRAVPPAALAAAVRTHPHVRPAAVPERTGDAATPRPTGNLGTPRPNGGYQDPRQFLTELGVPDEPLQSTDPVFAVDHAASLPDLRHQLKRAVAGRGGSQEVEEDFHLAASEIAANAFRHGRSPVAARLWAAPDRLLCTISDAGTSYGDPAAGYEPAHGPDLSRGGMGLWLARKLCDHVDVIRTPAGLTVRLVTALG